MDPSEAISKPKSPSSKICVVCAYSCLDCDYYAVFIVDLKSQVDEEGWVCTTPTLLVDRESLGNAYTFCVLNSTLFFIEFGRRARGNLPREGKSVYTYDLSHAANVLTSTKKSCILDKRMLRQDDMLCPKVSPAAIPTPDGKRILVFSTRFKFWSSYSVDDEIDFEVYDPLNKWKKLPSLQVECLVWIRESDGFVINTYAFVTNSIFLIQTDVAGMFVLDIDHLELGWRKERSFAGAKRIPFADSGRFFVVGKLCRFALSLSGAYDISNDRDDTFDRTRSSPLPISSFGPDFKHKVRGMHLLDEVYNNRGEGEGEGVVQLQTGIDEVTKFPHMLLDVCSFNLEKYKGDKLGYGESESVRLQASIVKSFKFVLNTHPFCWKFFPCASHLLEPLCLSRIGAHTE